MKVNDLLDMIGNADDGIIEEAKKRKKPAAARWTRWIAAAACLCLIVAAIVGIPKLINKTPSDTLEHRISDYGIGSKTIVNPVYISHNEMPKISENDILNSIKNNITVQGTLSFMDTVRINDNDSVLRVTDKRRKYFQFYKNRFTSSRLAGEYSIFIQ